MASTTATGKSNTGMIVIGVIIVACIILIIWWMTTENTVDIVQVPIDTPPVQPPASSLLDGYTYYQGMNTPNTGYSGPQQTMGEGDNERMAMLCNADPICVGFNTAGHLSNRRLLPSQMVKIWSAPGWGTYYKK